MKARIWFEAQGQSMRARGYTWTDLKMLTRLYDLPMFARRALARGHINAAQRVRAATDSGNGGSNG